MNVERNVNKSVMESDLNVIASLQNSININLDTDDTIRDTMNSPQISTRNMNSPAN